MNRELITEAVQVVMDRHDTLRTSFEYVDGTYMQRVHESLIPDLTFSIIDESEIHNKIQTFVKVFDLSKPSLFRIEIAEINQKETLFLVDIHHVVSDGKSLEILMDEIIRVYQGLPIPQLDYQYKDFVKEKLSQFNVSFQKQEDY